jgi:hypothetical protein
MKSLPGSINLMCVEGGIVTLNNILFSVLSSLLIALLIINFTRSNKERKIAQIEKDGLGLGAGIGGGILSFLGIYCAACALPVLSLLGVTISLNFLIGFETIFKIASLTLITLALYLVEQQLKKTCKICKI